MFYKTLEVFYEKKYYKNVFLKINEISLVHLKIIIYLCRKLCNP